MIKITWDTSGAKSIINRHRQQDYWKEIFDQACDEIGVEAIATTAVHSNLGQAGIGNVTGALRDSVKVITNQSGQITVSSNHPAAEAIEFGRYYENVDPKSPSIIQYAKLYGMKPWLLARAISRNGFYNEGRFVFTRAASTTRDAIADVLPKVTNRIAKGRSGN
tara:strand:- start:1111 stop:1602 length:492 start_codon:yes stop_codon:yes gene_type:complete